MQTYNGPIFDGDSHLYETPDAFTRYLPKELEKDWTIHFKTGADNEYALYVGERKVEITGGYMTPDGKVPPPGNLKEWLRAMKEGKGEVDMRVDMTPDMMHAEARLKKMDEFNVEGCLLYCGNMVTVPSFLDDAKAGAQVLHAYNRWMLDEWHFNYKDRIYSAPLISLADLDDAIREAEFVIKNGARAVLMSMGPSVHGRSPADPYYDRFWSLLNEAHVRVVFHVGEAIYLKHHMAVWGEKMQESRLRQSAFVWMHGYSERPVVETLSNFIFWNFFARFPNIKMLSAENGCEWVPNMLVKMDKVRGMAKMGYWPQGQLTERPSTIFKRHVGVVAYPEDDIRGVIDQTGSAEWIIMGSDYPHAEGVPEPKDFIEEAMGNCSLEEQRKVMYENGKKFMASI
ncbi:amidohydrolase family protein [Pseudomonas sp. BF-R-19]|uniref:amidohydrolase family protein n=1 Tax=Pseudomonas sp. BF-R-19 TaxID=2832397 RepID=UPI001CBC7F78|nr:amidohydrolase family protein [Pseudomonas sp. BF-R-19]